MSLKSKVTQMGSQKDGRILPVKLITRRIIQKDLPDPFAIQNKDRYGEL